MAVELYRGWGQIAMSEPIPGVAESLRIFRRGVDGKGEYEDLTWMDGRRLVTLPGFFGRIPKYGVEVIDVRQRLPEPDMEKALEGLRPYQVQPVKDLVIAQGGVASLPMAFGKTHVMAAIIKAYPHEEMVVRGTPMVVVLEPTIDLVNQTFEKLKALIPGRMIGKLSSSSSVMTDDILVTTYNSLPDIEPESVGILIADEVHKSAAKERAHSISALHNAARWGLSATTTGRYDGADLLIEGLFGPVVVRRTYADMVKEGVLAPIEVVWLPAPKPRTVDDRSYPKLVASATRGCPEFCDQVAELVRRIPNEMKTIVFTEHVMLMAELAKRLPGVPYVHGESSSKLKLGAKERAARRTQMEKGEIDKILSTYVWKEGVDLPDLSVVVSTSPGGSEIAAAQIPGRVARLTEGKTKGWLVDFAHKWDMERNGHPGRLLINDKARMNKYRELGFDQVFVKSIDEVPFVRS